MDITLNLDRETIHPIIKSYEDRIRRNKELANKMMLEARKLSELVSQLRYTETQLNSNQEESEKEEIIPTGYSRQWSLSKKIQFILQKSEKALTSKEIADQILTIDRGLSKDKSKAIKNISTILSIENGKNFKRIKDTNISKKEYFYSVN